MRRRRGDEADGRETAELAALADGSLPPERRAELEARVAASPELAELLAEQQRAVTLARNAALEVEAPASLRARIESPRRRRGPAVPRLALVSAVTATAAVAVFAVGLGVLGSRTSSGQFTAALAGTELAASASGEATLTRTDSGWRIDLDASGLPRLDEGRFYQAWLRNDDGVLVSVGTFNEGEDVTLWAGVSPEAFATLSVTREEADGNEASSGERVLVGTVDTG